MVPCTFSCLLTRSIKNLHIFSLVSCSPDAFTSFLNPPMIFSSSSSGNSPGISPDASKSLISTRKFSSGTCASVSRKTMPMFFNPDLTYS